MRHRFVPALLILFFPVALSAAEVGELPGSLLLVGGGPTPDAVTERFIELAGGEDAKIVVIPSASAEPDESSLTPWEDSKPASLTMLHAESREQADSEEFVKPLTEATAVWIPGGQQSRLAELYGGTRTENELHALLERGGVIGGTSAGAAIASKLMITGGGPDAETGTGFAFLPGFVVDQHFFARDRVNRLLGVIAANPGQVGLGIDESTAVVIRGRRIVPIGESYVAVCLAEGNGRDVSVNILRPGRGVADVVQLRRAAAARAGEPFPPEQLAEPVVESGTLIIGGGGGLPRSVVERFVELAGGGETPIVVVPTAMGEPLPKSVIESRILKAAGAKDVRIFHTLDREQANDPKFVKVLTETKGVWFSGGRQWRFVDAYEGTLAEKEFHNVLKRGGVIGGSSAGASIQSEYMPRGHPLGNLEVMAEGYERGFGFLPGCGVDQHFFERKRQPDMERLMRRYPQLLGIGLGEGSVIIVSGSTAEVAGRGKVAFYDRRDSEKEPVVLEPGEKFDLKARRADE